MKISTRTRYGIRAMIELAQDYGMGPLQVRIIAQRQDLSVKYLEQLMILLKSAGYIKGIRGSKGGYILARDPKLIKLSDVFCVLESSVTTVDCLEDEGYCNRITDCVIRQVFSDVQQAIMNVLSAVTLQDLADKAKNKKASFYQI